MGFTVQKKEMEDVDCVWLPFLSRWLQFQTFIQFRGKLKTRTAEEILSLKENQKMWNIHSVLNVLYSLIAKSNINQQVFLSLSHTHTQKFGATWDRFLRLILHLIIKIWCHIPLVYTALLTSTVGVNLSRGDSGARSVWRPLSVQGAGLLRSYRASETPHAIGGLSPSPAECVQHTAL